MKKMLFLLFFSSLFCGLRAQLPSSFSWRYRHGYDYVSEVKDQLIQGPCGVFAAIAAVEAMAQIYYNNRELNTFDFSEAYVYNSGVDGCPGIGCANVPASAVLDFAATTGLINDDAFTFLPSKLVYDDSDVWCIPDCSTLQTPSQHIYVPGLDNSWHIPPDSIDSVDELKQAILDYGPIIVQPGSGYRNGCTLHPSDQDCDHSHTVLFTGWSGSQWEIWDSWPGAPSFGLKTYDVFYFHSTFYRVYPVNPNNCSDVLRCIGDQSTLFSRKGLDRDGDGFYSWGLESYGRPSGCPGPNLMDWNDGVKAEIYRSGDTIYTCPTISGPDRVCTCDVGYREFVLNDVPPRFTPTWYISKNSSCFNTNQGSGSTVNLYPNPSCIGKESEITFRITHNGDGGYAEYKKSFYVNCPREDLTSLSVLDSYGGSPPKYGDTYYLCPYTTYNIFYNEYDYNCDVTITNWDLPSGWSEHYRYNNMVSIYTNDWPDGFMYIRGTTTCNSDLPAVTLMNTYFGAAECGGYFLAYPNPSGSFVDIDVDKAKVTAENIIIEGECLLSLVDKAGIIKFKTKFKGFPYRLDTSDLPEGLYFVKITHKGKPSTIRLIIKH